MSDMVAIILARGGSKRIPHKNIRFFGGKPMIAWAIEAAISSKLFQQVLVSTDSEEIATIAKEYGAECPSLRPAHLSDDYATTVEVLRHVLGSLKEQANKYKYCCCLYGTSFAVTKRMLSDASQILKATHSECVMSVAKYPHPVERSLSINKRGTLEYRHPQFAAARTQDLEPAYHDLGLMYWFDIDAVLSLEGSSLKALKISPCIMPRDCALDIDTEEDWLLAEQLIQIKNYNSVK